jgi:hypothetical protein
VVQPMQHVTVFPGEGFHALNGDGLCSVGTNVQNLDAEPLVEALQAEGAYRNYIAFSDRVFFIPTSTIIPSLLPEAILANPKATQGYELLEPGRRPENRL